MALPVGSGATPTWTPPGGLRAHSRGVLCECAPAVARCLPPGGLTPPRLGWEHAFVQPARRPHLAKEEIEQLRRSVAMLQPGALAMKREDAMRLLGDLGEVQRRLDRLSNGLRALLADDEA